MRGHSTETWVYVYYATYPYYCWPWSLVLIPVPVLAFFGDPFYDPFYYSLIPPSIPYLNKMVTFSNSRVMSFQYLASN